jgi:hypothetical protein
MNDSLLLIFIHLLHFFLIANPILPIGQMSAKRVIPAMDDRLKGVQLPKAEVGVWVWGGGGGGLYVRTPMDI